MRVKHPPEIIELFIICLYYTHYLGGGGGGGGIYYCYYGLYPSYRGWNAIYEGGGGGMRNSLGINPPNPSNPF